MLFLLCCLVGVCLGSDLCAPLNDALSINDACRCYRHHDGDEDAVWIGCTRATMPDIFKAFAALPHQTTNVTRLYLWDDSIPLVLTKLFENIRPFELRLESSHTGVVSPGAFDAMRSSLRKLEIRHNVLKQVSQNAFASLSELQLLDLSGNEITQLNVDSFTSQNGDLPSLSSLSLIDNEIEEIADGTFRHLSALEHLALSGNRIKNINEKTFAGLEDCLKVLDLERNEIDTIHPDAFSRLRKLESINLGSNRLDKIKISHLGKLEKVFLSDNHFESLQNVELSSLPSLKNVNLDSNSIQDLLPTNILPSLRILSLTNNQIFNISQDLSSVYPNLQTLSLQNNQIKVLTAGQFSDLTNLQHLFLSQNLLITIDSTAFSDLANLQVLSLSHNEISSMPAGLLDFLVSLKKLSLNDNQLTSLDKDVFTGLEETLIAVDVSDNPLFCTCSLAWITSWVPSSGPSRFIRLGNTFCDQPAKGLFAAALEEMRQHCPEGALNPAKRDSWITALGIILAALTIGILCTILCLYVRDQQSLVRVYTAQRIPSDMRLLIRRRKRGPPLTALDSIVE